MTHKIYQNKTNKIRFIKNLLLIKKIFTLFSLHAALFSFSQVGIGITSPTETLDVNGNIRSRTLYTVPGAKTDYYVQVDPTGVLKSTPKDYGGTGTITLNAGVSTELSTVTGANAKSIYFIDGIDSFSVTLPKAAGVAGKEVSFYIWGGNTAPAFYNFVGNSVGDGNVNKPSAVWLNGTFNYTANLDFRFTTVAGVNTFGIVAGLTKYRYTKITFISDGTNWWINLLR